VGASLLAMDVNDIAFFLDKRVALENIASKLASTGATPELLGCAQVMSLLNCLIIS
jgi:hypothetical protein